jgi:two-component system OmpR family sensor kinase
VRLRLAVISASLTFFILALFAVVVSVFAARQVHSEFDDDLKGTASDLKGKLIQPTLEGPQVFNDKRAVRAAASGGGVIWIFLPNHQAIANPGAASLGEPQAGIRDYGDYRVVGLPVLSPGGVTVGYLQYGKPRDGVRHTLARIQLFLGIGVVAGTVLAFFAGLALARRAMAPISNLTSAAQEIARTRDPATALPKPEADDEVADLANTLEDMLHALDASRAETEGALSRQREFVADASHELRTPLTSILANLEMLEAELDGDHRDMAGSALRSSRRMRRLVADLLLLARADAGRAGLNELLDLGSVVSEAAAEAAPVAAEWQRRRPARERRGGRPSPAGAEPDRERAGPHPAGHGGDGAPRQRDRRRGSHGGRRRPGHPA